MRIVSKFKDYYDYISHEFGEDPGVVYLRKSLTPAQQRAIPANSGFANNLADIVGRHGATIDHSLVFVVVGCRVFPFIRSIPAPFQRQPIVEKVELVSAKHEALFLRDHRSRKPKPLYPEVPDNRRLAEIIRLVGAPVFCLHQSWYRCVVDERVPVLADWGFPSILPATEAWQSIYTTLTSVLRADPDKAPPVALANDDRVVKAGFDLKTSFRHPVNEKRKK